MTGTFDDPPAAARHASRTTPAVRAVVLGGFALAALWTAWSAATGACPGPDPGASIETATAAWLAAGAWAFVSSLVLALRRGLRHCDWRAFGRYEMTDGTELIDWSTNSGKWYDMAVAEENERLMRED